PVPDQAWRFSDADGGGRGAVVLGRSPGGKPIGRMEFQEFLGRRRTDGVLVSGGTAGLPDGMALEDAARFWRIERAAGRGAGDAVCNRRVDARGSRNRDLFSAAGGARRRG